MMGVVPDRSSTFTVCKATFFVTDHIPHLFCKSDTNVIKFPTPKGCEKIRFLNIGVDIRNTNVSRRICNLHYSLEVYGIHKISFLHFQFSIRNAGRATGWSNVDVSQKLFLRDIIQVSPLRYKHIVDSWLFQKARANVLSSHYTIQVQLDNCPVPVAELYR